MFGGRVGGSGKPEEGGEGLKSLFQCNMVVLRVLLSWVVMNLQ